MTHILTYGAYVPYWRLPSSTIAAALGAAGARGTRAVASYDEDTTTLAVEAGRQAVRDAAVAARIDTVNLATSRPAYMEKTNATTVHAALSLDPRVRCCDTGGAVRSGFASLIAAAHSTETTLVLASDTRTGAAGGADEAGSGDAAAAFVVGDASAGLSVAEVIGSGSASAEFLDRWREPEDRWSRTWEERFGESIYLRLAAESFQAAQKSAGTDTAAITHFAVTGLSPRAAVRFGRESGLDASRIATDLSGEIGNTGTAHAGLVLAELLDRASPGDVIAVTCLADGADTLLLRASPSIARARPARTVRSWIDAGNPALGYADFLTWKGHLTRQAPRRPDPDKAAAPPSMRRAEWKFGFNGSSCSRCGSRHLPPQRVCLRCGSLDAMEPTHLADTPARVATYTVDHLAYSPAPPVIGVVLDFEGGGRYACELTDATPPGVSIGMDVEMTFRRISENAGVQNYFWKARPAVVAATESREGTA